MYRLLKSLSPLFNPSQHLGSLILNPSLRWRTWYRRLPMLPRRKPGTLAHRAGHRKVVTLLPDLVPRQPRAKLLPRRW